MAGAVSELLKSMEVETEVHTPMRGRGYDPDVIAIREELEKALKEGTARSFPNCSDAKVRETLARKVRSAGEKMRGKDEIKVATRYDQAQDKLIWGPKEVLDKLSSQTPTKATGAAKKAS